MNNQENKEGHVPIKDAFSNITSTPEFANLIGSVFGTLQDGMSNLETEFNGNGFPLNDIIKQLKKTQDSSELDIDDLDSVNDDMEDNIEINKVDNMEENVDLNIKDVSDSDLDTSDDGSVDNSEILECEISSGIEENMEMFNLKITELNSSLNNVFTAKNGKNIADILSEISENIKLMVNK